MRALKLSYFVLGKCGQETGIIGESFNLDADTIHIHTQQLGSIGGEGNFLNSIGIDKSQKVRVSDIGRTNSRSLNDGELDRFGNWWHVHIHGQEAPNVITSLAVRSGKKRSVRSKCCDLFGHEESEDGGDGELHFENRMFRTV
jgi:hypothetical protein